MSFEVVLFTLFLEMVVGLVAFSREACGVRLCAPVYATAKRINFSATSNRGVK